ncbi:MAG: hypothetical protein M3O28_05415, partial [Actinomycetota bacterium]|nr:hypothetical protein [Actinomycetota bacterium]
TLTYLSAWLNKTATQDRIVLSKDQGLIVLASLPAAGLVLGATYTLQLDMRGSTILVYVNGVQKLSYTLSGPEMSAYGKAKLHGLWMNTGGADPYDDFGSRWDNFSVLSPGQPKVYDTVPATSQAGNYTLALVDIAAIVEKPDAGANQVLLPTDTAVAIPVGAVGRVEQLGVGVTTFQALYGVTVRGPARAAPGTQYATGRWRKRAANDFIIEGDIAAVAAFDPSQLGGILQGWIKADSEASTDGSNVLPTERSGSGLTITQATTALQPIFKTNILNGLPAYRWDGATNVVNLSTLAALTAGEVFVIIKAVADPHSTGTKSGLWHLGSEPTNGSLYPFTDGVIYDDFGTTVRKTVGNPTPSLAAWRGYNVISTSSEYTANLDGAQIFTTATNTPGFPAAPTLGKSLGAFFFEGDIAELVLCNAKLSTTQRTSLKAYFNSKYGLAIA